jgi:hypothetical protein
MAECGVSGSNLGSQCKKQKGRVLGIVFNQNKTAVSIADLLVESTTRALFQTGGWHIFAGQQNEVTQPSNIEQTLDGGEVLKLGVNSAKFLIKSVKVSDPAVSAVESWDGKIVYGFLIYAGGFIQGKSFDGTNLEPIAMTLSSGVMYSTNTEAEMVTLNAMFNEGEQTSANKNRKTVDLETADYDLSDLIEFELKDTQIVISAGATNQLQIATVTTLEGVPVVGLVKEDFILTKGVSTDSVDTLTDNGDGSYKLEETVAVVAGTWVVTIAPPASLTLKGYENTISGTFTV